MPPKKKASEPSKKTEQKKKEKIIEDKTFGLKNKKGTKNQKYVKMVESQVKSGGPKTARQLEKEKLERFAAKEDKKKAKDELNTLFKPVEQKVGKGADPKSVLCAFFKAGTCKKGDKCKFSHDLNIARKGEKINIYADTRETEETMEDWDEAKLEEVVAKKHGETNKSMPKTAIICKFFLDAVENSKYGWFWSCPNGAGCHYRHALPEGFVLNKDKKKDEKQDEISLEELIEKERASINSNNLTRVTLQSFMKWKERKRKERAAKAKEESKKKKQDFSAGRVLGISGREMFEFNPDLIIGDDDDEEDGGTFTEKAEEVEYEGPIREINLDLLAQEEMECMREAEAAALAAKAKERPPAEQGAVGGVCENGLDATDETHKLDMAAGPDPEASTAAAIAAAMAAVADSDQMTIDTPIDENLFDGEDLDLVEDELEELDLVD